MRGGVQSRRIPQLPRETTFLSLLPLAMTVVSVVSITLFDDPHAARSALRRQKRNLFLMAGAFFILFYPFPAAMVYFWMIANILQALQQHVVKP